MCKISFNWEFIRKSSSLRKNFPIKILLNKEDFNEQLKNINVKYLLLLDYYFKYENNVFYDYILLINFILRISIGGSIGDNDINSFLNKIYNCFNNFLFLYTNKIYFSAVIEYRKIIESLVYLNDLFKNNQKNDKWNWKRKISNIGNEIKSISRNLYNVWNIISKFLHNQNDWNIKKVLRYILLNINFTWNELKKIIYIFNDNDIVDKIDLIVSKIEKNIENLDIKEKEEIIKNKYTEEYDNDKLFELLKYHYSINIVNDSINVSNIDHSNNILGDVEEKCINIFEQLDLCYHFKKRYNRNNLFPNRFYGILLKNIIGDIDKITYNRIYEIYKFPSVVFLKYNNFDYHKKLIKRIVSINILSKKHNNLKPLSVMLVNFLVNLNMEIDNGIFTKIYKFIEEKYGNDIIDIVIKNNNKNIREINKSSRHFYDCTNTKKQLDQLKLLIKCIDKVIEKITNIKIDAFFDNNKNEFSRYHDLFNGIDEAIKEENKNKMKKNEMQELFPFCLNEII